MPAGGLFLTAGADVQRDRIEVEVVAWGRGKASWSVDYRVIEGDTARARERTHTLLDCGGQLVPIATRRESEGERNREPLAVELD